MFFNRSIKRITEEKLLEERVKLLEDYVNKILLSHTKLTEVVTALIDRYEELEQATTKIVSATMDYASANTDYVKDLEKRFRDHTELEEEQEIFQGGTIDEKYKN